MHGSVKGHTMHALKGREGGISIPRKAHFLEECWSGQTICKKKPDSAKETSNSEHELVKSNHVRSYFSVMWQCVL